MKKNCFTYLELISAYAIVLIIIFFSSSIVATGNTIPIRMLLTVSIYVFMGLVIYIFVKKSNLSLTDLKVKRTHIAKQLLNGLAVFAFTFSIAVIIPLLFGIEKSEVLSFKATNIQILVFYIIYNFLCVALVEEFVFRGYFYSKIESISSKIWLPILLSSLMFGFIHFPNTLNLVNVIATTALGIVYSFCRHKFENCTLFSLTIAHGLHNSTILMLSFFIL